MDKTTLSGATRRKVDTLHRATPDHCHPVRLANGEEWLIPRPFWRIQPRFERNAEGNPRVKEVVSRFGYSNSVDDLVDALAHADDFGVVASIVATIAGELLRWIYDLDDSDLDALLNFSPSDPASIRWVRDVVAVVTFSESTFPAPETGVTADV